ncbi:MAG: hypothetical protein ACREDI_04055, partial [Roseiarcus sp.]
MTLGDGPADIATLSLALHLGGLSALTHPARAFIGRLHASREPARLPQGFKDSMPRLVMKFGGTSVADVQHIRNVAAHVKREIDAGAEVAVV